MTSQTSFEPLLMDFSTMTRMREPPSLAKCGMSALPELAEAACAATGSKRIAEIGTWAGQHAIMLADMGFEVYCFDTWEGSPGDVTGVIADVFGSDKLYKVFLKNCGDRIGRSIFQYRTSSLDSAKLNRKCYALVFIDANHEHPHVDNDIRAWWPHVLSGGILAGHDYGPGFPHVEEAVKKWSNETGVQFSVSGAIWFAWKTL